MDIDITPNEAKFLLELMDGDKNLICKDIAEKMQSIVTRLAVQDSLGTVVHTHKWEGEVCNECRHSSTVHGAKGGICFAANCDCLHFAPSGKEI